MGKRLISQRRGRGKRGVYSSPSHKHKGGKDGIKYLATKSAKSKITELQHDPGRTAPIAKAKVTTGDRSGERYNLIAAEGLFINQEVKLGDVSEVAIGNVLPLRAIPEGTPVFNIEAYPGDGGKFVRAAGTVASIVSHGTKTVVQLPSGQFKPFQPECRATVGVVAGGGRQEKPFTRAGKKYQNTKSKAQKYPRVSGVAMNPVDHPHGGGAHQHVGKPSTVSKHAPPGRKVGHISPKRGKKKRK